MPSAAPQFRYAVTGMDCAGCASKIDTAVRRIPGVEEVSVSATAGTMVVYHQPNSDLERKIQRQVTALGYSLRLVGPTETAASAVRADHDHSDHDHDHDHEHEHSHRDPKEPTGLHGHDHEPVTGPWWRSKKAVLTIASGLALVAAYGVSRLAPDYTRWIFAIAMLVGLVPIARRALMAAFAGTPFSIEMLMTIAAVGAVVIGASEEAATVVFLFLIGEMLEGVAAGRARANIQGLTALVPKTAFVERDGRTDEVPADQLSVGSLILIRPGDRIPADGLIVSGESSIDQAPVTGESTPVCKGVDDTVFAGTVNGEASLRVRVTATAADNTIARIVKLVEEAQESKAPTERFIDRFSKYYTPGVVIVAALVAVIPPLLFAGVWSVWIYRGLAILLIGCPCALVISTPAAIAAGLSAGARRGLLMKGGAVLETLRTVNAVAFDKTGTLTTGQPTVTDVVGVERPEAEVLTTTAALETGSSHPLAKAILARAALDGLTPPTVTDGKAIGGKGIEGSVSGLRAFFGSPQAARERASLSPEQDAQIAVLNDQGKTVSVLLLDDKVAGLVAVRDEPRPDARASLDALRAAGIRTIMLTGDNERAALAIGQQLGGIEVRAELLPADKQRIVGELMGEGLIVAKVGDGINDAPALAAANVGIAMGGGTDVALETADAAALHGRVGDVLAMVTLSRRTMGNITQNVTIALGLKVVFLVTTVLGITGLWPAILADTGATVLVTLNALRLLAPARVVDA